MRHSIKGKHLNKGAVSVDKKTKKENPIEANMMMLPAREGTCESCAVTHDPGMPHNAQSMFYQYRFYNEHGRWPTWIDAMSHCDEKTKQIWKEALERNGVNVEAGEVSPGVRA